MNLYPVLGPVAAAVDTIDARVWAAAVAALASLVSAIWSWLSARRADKSSHRIAAGRAELEHIDGRIEAFTSAYALLIAAVTRQSEETPREGPLVLARIIGAAEVLQIQTLTIRPLSESVERLVNATMEALESDEGQVDLLDNVRQVREEARAALSSAHKEKRQILTDYFNS